MEPLLLLHGAIGASDQLQPLADYLKTSFDVHMLDFTGHGGSPSTEQSFSIELFTNDVLEYMAQKGIESAPVFGYSMGGYVGMYIAKNHPGKISRIVTLATKYEWSDEIAAREVKMLDPDKIEQKLPAFAATLQSRHASGDWKELLRKTAEMMVAMGSDNPLKTDDYPQIAIPALLLLGDRDKMVSLDETVATYKALPNAQLGVLPNTQHPIEQVDMVVLSGFITRFLGPSLGDEVEVVSTS